LSAVFALLAASSGALAGDLDKVFLFNIEAQMLDKALLQFGAQVHMQLSFATDPATAAFRSPELKGRYTGKEALVKLLKGTRLRYVAHRQTIEILPQVPSRATELHSSSRRSRAQRLAARNDSDTETVTVNDPRESNSKDKKETLRAIVITGSRLLASSKEGPQEVRVYDREQIDQSGQTSIEDFMSTLPSVSLNTLPSNNGYSTTVQLRGLPEGTTLVLLDGRPLENSGLGGGEYFDLDDIPLAAVQRIEVDENGSSAVYGSGGIAGVVNIILKKNFSGLALDARYGWAKDSRTWLTNMAVGQQWDRGGLSVIASYELNSGLMNTDRALTASNDYTGFGGPDNSLPLCFPGNVFSLTGAPLPGAPAGSGASYAAVTGPTSAATPAFSNFTYGTLNSNCAALTPYAVISSLERSSILAQGHLDITQHVQLFTEIIYSNIKQNDPETYPSLFGIPGYQQFTVSASNPYNPFGETVGIADTIPLNPAPPEIINTDFFRPLVGLRGTLAGGWQWEVAAWQSIDWTKTTQGDIIQNDTAIQNALNSADAATALNPFVRGPIGAPALVQSLFSNAYAKFMGRDRAAQAFARGPVLRIPAGDVTAVIGAEFDQSALYINELHYYANFFQSSYRRSRNALFGESRIPLIGPRRGTQSPDIVALTVSGRYDHYSDFGNSRTGQAGIELRPVDGLLVRGTYSTAFEAPSLQQLFGPQLEYQTFVTDPEGNPGNLVPVTEFTGGNPNLRPLTGRSHTFGLVYSPAVASGLTVSVTNWNVVESNVIQEVPPQVLVDYGNLFPGRVLRGSSGQLMDVIDTEINFGSFDVAGLDYQVNYQHRIGAGRVSLDLGAAETYHYNQVLAPGQPAVEAVSQGEDDGDWAPRWKVTAGLGWAQATLSAHLDGLYTGAYYDYDSTRRIGNFWIVNANVRWRVGKWLVPSSRWFGEAYLEAGSTNLFNRGPQFSNYGFDFFGFDGAQALANLLGRSCYLDVGGRW
jgi:iron complex outermembrane receptor protein